MCRTEKNESSTVLRAVVALANMHHVSRRPLHATLPITAQHVRGRERKSEAIISLFSFIHTFLSKDDSDTMSEGFV